MNHTFSSSARCFDPPLPGIDSIQHRLDPIDGHYHAPEKPSNIRGLEGAFNIISGCGKRMRGLCLAHSIHSVRYRWGMTVVLRSECNGCIGTNGHW